ncbi:hypothetical protein BC940DRAFT_46016 [Gongronella butleri]|nr:hypothetical protein BC940DRAFT_46016 [Gongronella butleri]
MDRVRLYLLKQEPLQFAAEHLDLGDPHYTSNLRAADRLLYMISVLSQQYSMAIVDNMLQAPFEEILSRRKNKAADATLTQSTFTNMITRHGGRVIPEYNRVSVTDPWICLLVFQLTSDAPYVQVTGAGPNKKAARANAIDTVLGYYQQHPGELIAHHGRNNDASNGPKSALQLPIPDMPVFVSAGAAPPLMSPENLMDTAGPVPMEAMQLAPATATVTKRSYSQYLHISLDTEVNRENIGQLHASLGASGFDADSLLVEALLMDFSTMAVDRPTLTMDPNATLTSKSACTTSPMPDQCTPNKRVHLSQTDGDQNMAATEPSSPKSSTTAIDSYTPEQHAAAQYIVCKMNERERKRMAARRDACMRKPGDSKAPLLTLAAQLGGSWHVDIEKSNHEHAPVFCATGRFTIDNVTLAVTTSGPRKTETECAVASKVTICLINVITTKAATTA